MNKRTQRILDVVGDKWEKPETEAKSICSFDLFFLRKLAEHQKATRVTEFGCGATTMELTKAGFGVKSFSLDISMAAQKAEIKVDFVKCNVMDKSFLDQIIESVKQSQLLVIDCLHSEEMAKYYSTFVFPHADCLIWIHDYWNDKKYIPYGEQRYLDRNVIGKTHDIWTLTDLPKEELKIVGERIGFKVEGQKHPRPLTKNDGPKLCSVVLEKKNA